ncbi:uncharacterized protein LOC106883826 [Octopus bimaculoides]|uniref:Uncharacterized protein n=1 Tax=Octopus bimaculoides TaxID=37653 RepID=A0A0L8I7P0_OCTBM|nr:uncharacterized protein LOC106883826 [Octopus bimaculoides]|eukprot:XP_014790452.1 PREDICTED: uncharacterized protein LOC106883826 [Octopus bimaculoides]
MINWKIFTFLVYFFCFPALHDTGMSFFTVGPIKDVIQKGRQLFLDQGAQNIVKSGTVPYNSSLAVSYGKLDKENFIMMGHYVQVMMVTCKNILQGYSEENPIHIKDFIYQMKHSGLLQVANRTEIQQISIDFISADKMAERLQNRYQQDLVKKEDILQHFGLELQDFANIVSTADADEILTNQTVLDINLLVLPGDFDDSLKVHHLEFKISRESYQAPGFETNQNFVNGTFYSIEFEPNEEAINEQNPESYQVAVVNMLKRMPSKDEL